MVQLRQTAARAGSCHHTALALRWCVPREPQYNKSPPWAVSSARGGRTTMNPAPAGVDLRTWKAASWDELRSIWNALSPPPDPASGKVVRTFRSRDLTPSEAGFVFERWLMEALRLS